MVWVQRWSEPGAVSQWNSSVALTQHGAGAASCLSQRCSIALMQYHAGAGLVQHCTSATMQCRLFTNCGIALVRCCSIASHVGAALQHSIAAVSNIAALRWGSVAASHWHSVTTVRRRVGVALPWCTDASVQHRSIALVKCRVGAAHSAGWSSIAAPHYAVLHWYGMLMLL